MALIQGYWADNEDTPDIYSEGPFVLVKLPMGHDDYRIECQTIGAQCSTFPDMSVVRLLKKHGLELARGTLEKLSVYVDFLNKEVSKGAIELKGNYWVAKEG